jgi:polyisoprenoid-binding protein YceI
MAKRSPLTLRSGASARGGQGFKILGAVSLALLLTACGTPKSRPAGSPHAVAPAISEAGSYHVDRAQSELRILVYRAGPMERLGHNHVIVNRAVDGAVAYAGDLSAASFSLSIPSAAFRVDDADMRAEEGADFAEDVSDDAKAGTLRNMLSAAVLDAAQFPDIAIRSISMSGTNGSPEATLNVRVAGHESRLVVPFTVDISPGRLVARGTLTLRQSALGLTPLSIFLGALRVQDEMRLKFKFVAVYEPGAGVH